MRRCTAAVVMAVAMLGAGLFVCTIKDDAGSIVNPNDNTNPNPIGHDSLGPVLIVASAESYLLTGDTMTVAITVVHDSVLTSRSEAYSGAQLGITASAGWVSDDSLTTDRNGRATLRFSDSVERQNVQITITCGDAVRVLRVDVTNQADQVQKLIEVSASRPSIKADGRDTTTIRVAVIDSNHNPLVGEPFQFISTAGMIKGTDTDNPGRSVTDGDGVATAVLTSSNINDTAFVTVYLVGNLTMMDETQVAFLGVSISARTDSSNLTPGAMTTITATLLNASNEPIARSPIYFTRGKGSSSPLSFVDGSIDSVTGFDGTARAIIEGESNGTDSVIITAAGARTTLRINVTSLVLTAEVSAPVIQANSDEIDTLRVTFTDNNGNALNNKAVRVIASHLAPKGEPMLDTLNSITSAGISLFTFTALPYEAEMRLEVTAYNQGDLATVETSIEFMATRNITTYAMPPVIPADGTSKSQITVQVKNESNNPIADDTLLFTTTAGMIPSSAVTDADGRAIVNLTGDRRNTTAVVHVTLKKDPTVTDSARVEFSGVELRASASPQSINSNGVDTSYVTVTLQDAMKNNIVGERVFFTKQQSATRFVLVDSVTDNRGNAVCKVVGAGTGQDTIGVSSAGARANAVIYYSSNYLVVDTASATGRPHSYIANGQDSTLITVKYREGDETTPIPNALIEASVTLGTLPNDDLDTVFACTLRTDSDGEAQFYVFNPDFANWTTIQAKAIVATEITTASLKVYFKADIIDHIDLVGTPEVISTNGSRAKITAIAYDAQNNRVKDATVAFNLVNGPGGGEYLDPPTAVTGIDGSAVTYLVSGPLPSNFREVWIAAGDFSVIKSDTVRFTIAGPPAYVTIRRQIGELAKNANGTYGLNCAALVTDINGNPVADGTEVTFSAKITGYYIYPKTVNWTWHPYYWNDAYYRGGYWTYTVEADSARLMPFEDLNDNFSGGRPEPGEDRDRDGIANRGEDINGDGVYQPGPGFEDIDWNGYRNFNPEPSQIDSAYDLDYSNPVGYDTSVTAYGDTFYTAIPDTVWSTRRVYADLNGNGDYDTVEPLTGTDTNWTGSAGYQPNCIYNNRRDCAFGSYPDIDWNNNGLPDPATTIIITRTVQTKDGIAENELIYGQSDALHVRAMINCEAQGKIAASPEEFMLPILAEDYPYWSPK